ncbi:MAG: VWA domain-containing protein [Proteobacteria bacterium]|nr:VWA domain-containing protein [Pseudomonadota bacterium]
MIARDPRTSRARHLALRILRAVWPWLLVAALGALGSFVMNRYLQAARGAEPIVWHSKRVFVLLAACGVVGLVAFHLHRRRAAAMGFSQVAMITSRGVAAWLSDLPAVLRILAIAALVVGLARPETFRTVKHEVDSVDIILVVDMSKSMEDPDMPRDRMDAAQRVIRRFLRRNTNDRIGLVIFGQQAMLQCPLTHDSKMLEQIVADLTIGDVPELGTAIGDGLALAVAQLRRSDAKSKVVILLSDGDSNWVTRFDPEQASAAAKAEHIKVNTVLVGREESDLLGGMSVNPATLMTMAETTGGEFYRATDYESFDRGFQTMRSKLDSSKRIKTERIPDKQLFGPFLLLAAALIFLELVLSHGRLRRLP